MNQLWYTVFLSLFGFAVSCQNAQLLRRGIQTEEQRKGIVELHNQLRNYVASGGIRGQPTAQNMREMRWDYELAELAQRWADGCVYAHTPTHQLVTKKGKPVGQNIFLFTTARKEKLDFPDFDNMIHKWFNEVYDFGYDGTFNYNTGHYSQIIWGQTNKIGCGYAGYYAKNTYHNYLVCNYFPAGNQFGSRPYEYGPVDCEEHDLFRSWRYNFMCTIDKYLINACQINWKSAGNETSIIEKDEPITTTEIDLTTTENPTTSL